MQFRDLKKQYEVLRPQIDNAVQTVCADANFISGKQVQQLEQQLAEYVGRKHCITCANGTDALSLVLMAWGIGEGDAVFVPDFTFFASGEVVSFEGATPVFVDVVEETFNIDVKSLRTAIELIRAEGKLRPRAIIAVDLFGQPADYIALEKLASEYDLLLLEDGAQGFGGAINGKKACGFGDAATTSFFPAKPLGCYGDGGAIFVDDDHIAQVIRSYAIHGKGDYKYDNVRIGVNSRLDTLQAAILQVKLEAFVSYELIDVNRAAANYAKLLHCCGVALPVISDGFYSSWAQYTIRLQDSAQRTALTQFLKEKEIPSMVYYPKPMCMQKAFSGTRSAQANTPVSARLCETVLSLPLHPYITQQEQEVVAATIKEFTKTI